ncbi:MAG: hypothetical protein Q8P28_04340 [Deltaproteobacteria bacterium]|nr:hypothetical protein [Deltaproteobacteria bacterium]
MADNIINVNTFSYKPHYFHTWELVPKDTYEKFGGNSFMFFPANALQMIDGLREFLGVPLFINNWHDGGDYEYSGLRPITCKIGAVYSQHRLGQAFDIKPLRMTIGAAYKKIMDNISDEWLKYITVIENIEYTPTWLHVDCRNIPDRIRIVKP